MIFAYPKSRLLSSAYGNFAKCHQAHFRVSRVGLGTRPGVHDDNYVIKPYPVMVQYLGNEFVQVGGVDDLSV